MKKLVLSVAAIAAVLGGGTAMADPSDPPYPTGPYLSIVRYYDDTPRWPFTPSEPQLAGWEITYCDFTTETTIFPGRNITMIEIQEGSCL